MSKTSGATGRQLVAKLAVVALLIGSCVATAGLAGADSTITDLDHNTPLTERDTWSTFRNDGVATADVAAPALKITVAKEHEDVDVGGFHNDYANEFVRVEYDEDIDRTIRFYVPSNYWKPYFDESAESIAGDDVVAKLVPVAGGKYTAVTIRFSGKTDAVFAVSQLKGSTWSFWSEQDEKIEETTGVSTGIAGTSQWNYARSSDWSNGTLVVSNVSDPSRVMIQYDGDVSAEEEVWLRVPKGESSRTPAYYFVREPSSAGENASIVVVSKNEEPPSVRLKTSSNPRDGVGSIFSDWSQIPARFDSWFAGVFGSAKK
jgi:hypothetical protein